jgi:hypothetical protein
MFEACGSGCSSLGVRAFGADLTAGEERVWLRSIRLWRVLVGSARTECPAVLVCRGARHRRSAQTAQREDCSDWLRQRLPHPCSRVCARRVLVLIVSVFVVRVRLPWATVSFSGSVCSLVRSLRPVALRLTFTVLV